MLKQRSTTPNNLKGNKLRTGSVGRIMRLKLKKIEEIRTSRSEMEMFMPKQEGEEYE